MRDLIANATEFNKIGQLGKDYAVEHFSKEVCVTQLIQLLE